MGAFFPISNSYYPWISCYIKNTLFDLYNCDKTQTAYSYQINIYKDVLHVWVDGWQPSLWLSGGHCGSKEKPYYWHYNVWQFVSCSSIYQKLLGIFNVADSYRVCSKGVFMMALVICMEITGPHYSTDLGILVEVYQKI